MNLFLVRHGQTEWNHEKRMQGRLDSPLAKEGKAWGQKAATLLSTIDQPARLFSSPLGRAYETAELIAQKLRCPIEITDLLLEMNHGQFDGLTRKEADSLLPGFIEKRTCDRWNIAWPQGESYAMVYERGREALNEIRSISDCASIVCVGHETINKMIAGIACGWEKDEIMAAKQFNNHIYALYDIEYNSTFRRIEG